MLHRLRTAGLLWPALWMLPALALLLGLGVWQLQRKAWKEALMERIVARTKAEPVSIDDALKWFRESGDVEYLRVRLNGRFLHDQERYFYAPDPRFGPGYHVYTPVVVRAGAKCADVVLVNRGFVPEAFKDPSQRSAAQINAPVVAVDGAEAVSRLARGPAVVGLVRLPERPGWFTPANDVAKNLWFWRDLVGLWASLPDSAKLQPCAPGARPYPFVLDAEAEPANPGGWPKGGTTRLEIPNRHLEYVLTWFGLAATLIGVFAAFAVSRLRDAGAAATSH